ncbi:MAG: hypothetical protein COB98_04595 [Flavobacteriaceae bacterium]|nr:MAG: hypothetical protein COB98_04595 [Flavobacteriaceae bacterium]
MKYSLENIPVKKLKHLEKAISLGAKFVVFNYRIGLGAVSLLKCSPAIFIANSTEISTFRKKYDVLNFVLGPWFFLKGPFLTYDAYKINQRGGIDVTKDIMSNLTQESLDKNEVEIKAIHSIFTKVSLRDKKDIIKALKKIAINTVPLKKIHTALFVNVAPGYEPHFVIGITLYNDKNLDISHVKKCLNTVFYKHVQFEIIDLKHAGEYGEKLIEQGNCIYG